MSTVYYTDGHRYQLEKEYYHWTPYAGRVGGNDFVWLDAGGRLELRRGYAWDGASGPAINTKNFVRASLVHDALYQLIRLGVLDKDGDRKIADELLRDIAREDGMSWFRSSYVYAAVRAFGGTYMTTVDHPVLTAP